MHFYKGKKCYLMWSFLKVASERVLWWFSLSRPHITHTVSSPQWTSSLPFCSLLISLLLHVGVKWERETQKNAKLRKPFSFNQSVSLETRLCTFYFCGHVAFHVAADSQTRKHPSQINAFHWKFSGNFTCQFCIEERTLSCFSPLKVALSGCQIETYWHFNSSSGFQGWMDCKAFTLPATYNTQRGLRKKQREWAWKRFFDCWLSLQGVENY